jgi:putative Mg2+ transporter-C (MgtC) family protein
MLLADSLERVVDVLREDFSGVGDVAVWVRLSVRLVFAAVLGGALGWQREWTGKAAGLRTHMLVAMGAALFVAAAQQAGIGTDHLSRVIQGIVTGIGFVGGGAILKLSEQRQIKGLTTATAIWLSAGVGVAAGLGKELSAVLGTVLALLVLSALVRLEKWIDAKGERERATRARSDAEHSHQKEAV